MNLEQVQRSLCLLRRACPRNAAKGEMSLPATWNGIQKTGKGSSKEYLPKPVLSARGPRSVHGRKLRLKGGPGVRCITHKTRKFGLTELRARARRQPHKVDARSEFINIPADMLGSAQCKRRKTAQGRTWMLRYTTLYCGRLG